MPNSYNLNLSPISNSGPFGHIACLYVRTQHFWQEHFRFTQVGYLILPAWITGRYCQSREEEIKVLWKSQNEYWWDKYNVAKLEQVQHYSILRAVAPSQSWLIHSITPLSISLYRPGSFWSGVIWLEVLGHLPLFPMNPAPWSSGWRLLAICHYSPWILRHGHLVGAVLKRGAYVDDMTRNGPRTWTCLVGDAHADKVDPGFSRSKCFFLHPRTEHCQRRSLSCIWWE